MEDISIYTNSLEIQESKTVAPVKGMTKMKNYYSKVLYPFVECLIRDHSTKNITGYELDIDDLSSDDQYQFTKHLIEYDDRNLYCLSDNESKDDIVCSILALLTKDDIDNKIDFADLIKEKVISYYKNQMQSLIDDILPWVEQEDFSDMGYVKAAHPDDGETFWVHR